MLKGTARRSSAPSEARESETVRVPYLPSRELIRWARALALAERIEQHLALDGDEQVRADLAQIRALASEVLR